MMYLNGIKLLFMVVYLLLGFKIKHLSNPPNKPLWINITHLGKTKQSNINTIVF